MITVKPTLDAQSCANCHASNAGKDAEPLYRVRVWPDGANISTSLFFCEQCLKVLRDDINAWFTEETP